MRSLLLSDWLLQHLDKARDEPLNHQVYRLLQRAILSGRLEAEMKLPSSRSLAKDLGVARNTIIQAYDQLTAESYVQSSQGSGTYVADTTLDRIDGARLQNKSFLEKHEKKLSRRGKKLIQMGGWISGYEWGPFLPGVPEVLEFPVKIWNRLECEIWSQPRPRLMTNAPPGGYRPLRRAVTEYLRVSRSVNCNPDQVVITTGIHQAVDLAVRLLSDPKDRVWLEDPCYWGVRNVLHSLGLSLVPIPLDDEGLSLPKLERPPRIVFVTPSHQYPLGMVMSLGRRRALLDYAQQHRCWIIEDDYDSEFRYGSRPLSSLQGLDSAGRVIYVGSFSKTLFPGLRVGYLVAPPELADKFARGAAALYREGQLTQQAVLADFIDQGFLNSHIRRVRALYGERRSLLIDAITAAFGRRLPVLGDNAGLHLVLGLPECVDDRQVAAAASAQGIIVRPLTSFYNKASAAKPGLLLGYGCVPIDQLRSAFDKLATVIQTALEPPAR
jgi:GntR family transcriptional regulator/MocR family aminotransferase